MKVEEPFAKGINSVLVINWSIKLATPLCIRNGSKFKWKQTSKEKSRNTGVQFLWNEPKEGNWNEIQDLHYALQLQNNHLTPFYQIPASSLRGAMRSWSLQHLSEEKDWPVLTGINKEESGSTDISLEDVKNKLNQYKNGLSLIAGLFGLTFQSSDETEALSFASRLWVETLPFHNQQEKPDIDSHSMASNNNYGPQNAWRQIMLRGPVDRITHSAKEGGLHSFLEFSAGQHFEAQVKIMNPQTRDLGLVALWEREIDAGFLRLGALSSAGRGRLSILQDKSHREIHAVPGETVAGLTVENSAHKSNDIIAGLWHKCLVPWDEKSKQYYLNKLKNSLKNNVE